MKIHEYQAKEILRRYGVPTLNGKVAFTAEEADAAAKELGTPVVVVKSMIHAGGRGKGRFKEHPDLGGVKVVKPGEAKDIAKKMLGSTLVTIQTGAEGKKVGKVYVDSGCDIARELYLGMTLDRQTSRITIMASTEGGVNIEEVAVKTPEKITTLTVDPASGLWPFHTRIIASALKLEGDQAKQCARLVSALYRLFLDKDASLIEINPLVVTKDGKLICLDAKIGFDDNAVFRRPDIEALRDFDQEEPAEVEAQRLGLSYVKLDGTIGCMVNGAGLAMATMDIIKLRGGEPANFLDVGGGASKEKIAEAFKIILSDPHVKGVLVNIFGGIMRCDVIAEGIIEAVREVKIGVPLVARLEGTNVARGKTLLQESGLYVIPADDLDDAARRIVAAVKDAA